jgi:hypothetical protein
VFNQKNLAIISYSIVHSIERKENLPWGIGMKIADVLADVPTKSEVTEIVAVGTRIATEAEILVTGPVANIVAVVKRRATEEGRRAGMATIVSRDAEVSTAGVVVPGVMIVDRVAAATAPRIPNGETGRAKARGVAVVTMAAVVVVRKEVEVVTVAAVMKAPAPAEASLVAGEMSLAGVKGERWAIVAKNIAVTIRSVVEEVIVRVAEIVVPVRATTGVVDLAKRVVVI